MACDQVKKFPSWQRAPGSDSDPHHTGQACRTPGSNKPPANPRPAAAPFSWRNTLWHPPKHLSIMMYASCIKHLDCLRHMTVACQDLRLRKLTNCHITPFVLVLYRNCFTIMDSDWSPGPARLIGPNGLPYRRRWHLARVLTN